MSDEASHVRVSATHRAPLPRRLSLERKLPLAIGALLLAVIVALSAASYAAVRRVALGTATQRLTEVTRQFAELFQLSAAQTSARFAALTPAPEALRYARTRDASLRDRARRTLIYSGPNPEQSIVSALVDSTGAFILADTTAHGLDTVRITETFARATFDSAAIGSFVNWRDTLAYPVVTPVRGAPGVYLVRWRKVSGSRRQREQLTRLVGSDADIYLGNAAGSEWMNLESRIGALPFEITGDSVREYSRESDGNSYLASTRAVPGTPWMVAIDFPLTRVMAPVDTFMQRIAVIALGALALGLLGAWLVSRRITRPILQLTNAADSLAGGDYSVRADVRASDEVGRLAVAFNTMATEVRQARENLEHKVEERTRDLNLTLQQLHDAQGALVRRERLAMLGQLSSGVGHELRNPLGVMTNAVYYLKTVLSAAPKNVHEYLDILQQQITLSEKIVGDLLDFARSKPPQRKPTSMAEVTELQLQRLSATPGVSIDKRLPPDLPAVLADPVQIGQVVLNLVTNALQAMDGKGKIEISAHSNGGSVVYEVSDSGPGVAPENRDKIFEPLFTTKARGIGLGLAVSRTIARANGGDLTLESPEGTAPRGATFRLTIPLASS